MATKARTGFRHYLAANAWVIVADVTGALLLVSLLLTAAGAPALKEWIFVLLTTVPLMAMVTMLAPRREPKPVTNVLPIRPAIERKIIISPRPYNQRTSQAA